MAPPVPTCISIPAWLKTQPRQRQQGLSPPPSGHQQEPQHSWDRPRPKTPGRSKRPKLRVLVEPWCLRKFSAAGPSGAVARMGGGGLCSVTSWLPWRGSHPAMGDPGCPALPGCWGTGHEGACGHPALRLANRTGLRVTMKLKRSQGKSRLPASRSVSRGTEDPLQGWPWAPAQQKILSPSNTPVHWALLTSGPLILCAGVLSAAGSAAATLAPPSQ